MKLRNTNLPHYTGFSDFKKIAEPTPDCVGWYQGPHRNVEMDIDTKAAVSLISRPAIENLLCEADKPKLWPISQKLATYTGESITP